MNKLLNIAFIAMVALLMTACGKEDPFFESEETGMLSVKKMIVQIENEENVVRSSIDIGSFLVEIIRDTEIVHTYTYAEMPEVITLPVGVYTVGVRSGDVADVAWEAPYFEGMTQFEVKAKEITEVETVVCALANVRVSVFFDETIAGNLSDDSKVTVEMGNGASIDFTKNETRSAYFAYVPGSNTMVATFKGKIDGDSYEELRAYADVKPGNHYKITYSHSGADVPGNEGVIKFAGLLIDASVEEENLRVNLDVEDPLLDPDERPSEGGGETPPTPPVEGGPEIVVPQGSKIDIDGNVVDIVDGDNYSLLITSESGFTVFKVDIVSPYLTEDFLQGVGLTTHLDLVNPGAYADAISGLGLPCNVRGSKKETFDISSLVPLLAADPNSEVHEFRLTVTDAAGTVNKILKFRN